MPELPIRKLMTRLPHTIANTQTMQVAHAMMRTHQVRHLPVMEGGRLIGVVSDGDLHLVETLRDVDPTRVLVEDAMTQDVYTVDAATPVSEVVRTMARRKLGSAVVTAKDRVVGIFTTVDACRAFADHLKPAKKRRPR